MFFLKRIVTIAIALLLLVGCQTEEKLLDVLTETNDRQELAENMDELKEDGEKELDLQEDVESDQVTVVIEEETDVEKKYEIDSVSWRVKHLKESNEQIVLITIDDAPDQYSVELAEKLKKLDAGAIFFVNGHFLKSEEDRNKLRNIHELGFVIGNHTMNHPNMSHLSKEEQEKEIIELNNLIEEIIGERPKFYRAPFGVNTEESKAIVEQEGMISMNWTYGYDWETEYQNAEALAEIMVNTPLLINGANLLMHDRKWTVEAIDEIVTGLRDKGYEPVNPLKIKTK
ncbi:polysaccharide deacetylase family protein [Halalkalibacter alkalisediminis]|uniref:Polysaccharide deacetylase family protein n=1 Tax=Halalkalibacter alkalisediminis TaxID=935616 RepID=A0ABV6NDB5_9BACI